MFTCLIEISKTSFRNMILTTWSYAEKLTVQEPCVKSNFIGDDDIVIGAFEQCSQSLCIENEFQSGDTIRFKFFDGVVSHYV